MLNIGCHLSTSKGYVAMGREALAINANTFQFFTRNPRGGKAKAINVKDIESFLELFAENGFVALLAHAPYTLNACAAEERIREFAFETMADDLQRLEHLPGSMYNFHPGSHVGQGVETGVALITEVLNHAMWSEQHTMVLLETMSGKGSEIGRRFEEIKAIIDGVVVQEKIGVCLDTCHIHAAGYDIVNDLEGVLETFDDIIGLHRLKAIHLNDSQNPLGSHKDRHAKIGEGTIGLEAVVRLINHPKLRHLPFYLETPNESEGYAQEIQLLRRAYLS